VTRNSGNILLLAWADSRSGGQPDIYAHQIDLSGAPVWAANGVLVTSAAHGQYYASLAPYKTAAPVREYVAWTDNRVGDTRYIFFQRLDSNGATQLGADGTTPTTLAMVSATAETDRVRLMWYASEHVAATVYRRTADQDWSPIGEASSDGSGQIAFEDRDVVAGARYGYRLGFFENGQETFAGETWVTIPTDVQLAIGGLEPNPAVDELVVSFTLPSGDAATLEMIDVSGRRVLARALTGLSAGRHTLRLDQAPPAAGVYFLRLTQKGRSVTARAAYLR
jgi:hypothetical protein